MKDKSGKPVEVGSRIVVIKRSKGDIVPNGTILTVRAVKDRGFGGLGIQALCRADDGTADLSDDFTYSAWLKSDEFVVVD